MTIPNFNSGQKLNQISAAGLNEIAAQARKVQTARGDQFIKVQQTPDGGLVIGLNINQVLPYIAKTMPIKRAKTQEAAQGDLLISVKLLDSNGDEVGDAFDATFIATDGATAANSALPRVADDSVILITQIDGTWYVVNPTLIKSSACP